MKNTIIAIVGSFVLLTACSDGKINKKLNESVKESNMNKDSLRIVYKNIQSEFAEQSKKVIQPAEGYLKYPYLIPAGFYKQMWDWDGFFMGNHFVSQGKPEYLKYWALNLIEGIDKDGYVSG